MAGGHFFTCAAVRSDAYHTAGGMTGLAEEYEWIVVDGEVVSVDEVGPRAPTNEWWGYMINYGTWLAATYPEVYADIEFVDIYPASADVPTALKYIDEFVASQG